MSIFDAPDKMRITAAYLKKHGFEPDGWGSPSWRKENYTRNWNKSFKFDYGSVGWNRFGSRVLITYFPPKFNAYVTPGGGPRWDARSKVMFCGCNDHYVLSTTVKTQWDLEILIDNVINGDHLPDGIEYSSQHHGMRF